MDLVEKSLCDFSLTKIDERGQLRDRSLQNAAQSSMSAARFLNRAALISRSAGCRSSHGMSGKRRAAVSSVEREPAQVPGQSPSPARLLASRQRWCVPRRHHTPAAASPMRIRSTDIAVGKTWKRCAGCFNAATAGDEESSPARCPDGFAVAGCSSAALVVSCGRAALESRSSATMDSTRPAKKRPTPVLVFM